MTKEYLKPWVSYEGQLDQLVGRGMVVSDRGKALKYLERIGYYRLSGYWYPFRERAEASLLDPNTFGRPKKIKIEFVPMDEFKAGTTFLDVVDLYVFDKRLRLLVLDALERVEIALRVDISHHLGRYDRFAYLRPELFHKKFAQDLAMQTGVTGHHGWLSNHAKLIGRSKEDFIRHNREKYGLPLAIWVACEVWDFGTLSKLFDGMREEDQDQISAKYGVANGRVFATWLRSLNYMRNVCAHHSRLWNRNIVDQPRLPEVGEVPELEVFRHDAHRQARVFMLLCLTQFLMRRINPSSTWGRRMMALLEGFPNLSTVGLSLDGMGVDAGWRERGW